MNHNEIEEKLKEIKTENYIWLLYIGIIFISWYSNNLEKDYFLNNNLISKEKYRKTLILIFSILIVVYLYFLKSAINDINNLKLNDTDQKKNLVYLSFIGSLLIVVSGIIFLYIAIKDEDISVELAFN